MCGFAVVGRCPMNRSNSVGREKFLLWLMLSLYPPMTKNIYIYPGTTCTKEMHATSKSTSKNINSCFHIAEYWPRKNGMTGNEGVGDFGRDGGMGNDFKFDLGWCGRQEWSVVNLKNIPKWTVIVARCPVHVLRGDLRIFTVSICGVYIYLDRFDILGVYFLERLYSPWNPPGYVDGTAPI